MENPRTVVIVCVLAALVPGAVFAYERDTHRGLTDGIVKSYENIRGDAFTAEEETALVQGSWDEDDDWRFLQHFYDPVNNRGIRVVWQRQTSKEWANDQEAQGGKLSLGEWEYFSREGDYTWDRAVFEYAHGDRAYAVRALGHVLHLIEDAAVPAHVRGDMHPNVNGAGDADPYEHYTGRYGLGSVAMPAHVTVQTFSTLKDAFDAVANFTNRNFVSKDTLFEGFDEPDIDALKVLDGFVYNKQGVQIARAIERFKRGPRDGERKIEIHIDDDHNTVVSSTWTALSQHAIESGVGVVDLFFRAVEEEKRTNALKKKNEEQLKQRERRLVSGFSFVKAIYGSSLKQGDVEELLNEGQAGAAAAAFGGAPLFQEPQSQTPPQEQFVPSVAAPAVTEQKMTPPVPLQTQQIPPSSIPSAPNYAPQGLTFIPGGGGPVASQEVEESSTQDVPESPLPLTPAELSIISPADNSTLSLASVTFSGTSTASAIITITYGTTTATTTANAVGEWTLASVLPEGTTVVSFTAASSITASSETKMRTITIDTTGPDAPAASVAECAYSLSESFCLVPQTSATLAWSAVNGAAHYALVKDGVTNSTTTNTSAVAPLTDQATTTLALVAYDAAGNASATSTEVAVVRYTGAVIVNEIAWAGSNASAADEWIELYNPTQYAIAIDDITLASEDGVPELALSGTLLPQAYYLIERTDDDTISDMAADLIVPFSGTGAGSGLSNDGEELRLTHRFGTEAAIVMDQTPAVSTCGGWCAGSDGGFLSMERISGATDGTLEASWRDNDAFTINGSDADGNVILGTPGQENSPGAPLPQEN